MCGRVLGVSLFTHTNRDDLSRQSTTRATREARTRATLWITNKAREISRATATATATRRGTANGARDEAAR
jgi:hypothetical protein